MMKKNGVISSIFEVFSVVVSLMLFLSAHFLFSIQAYLRAGGTSNTVNFFGSAASLTLLIDICLYLAIGLLFVPIGLSVYRIKTRNFF
ncbi:MAG: hypothetical protein JW891_07890 [Candidatus Lokiarchaeota archaeon]|nr:hypothetical protein [Candidatus Lokiarchaeota archaeon]